MERDKQLERLKDIGDNRPFPDRIRESNRFPLIATGIDILQINVGKICNLSCRHCHVTAGPHRSEVMPREVLEKCLEIFRGSDISTLDITGGAPEMNPYLHWLLDQAGPLGRRVIVRSNLVILLDEKYSSYIESYVRNRIELIASLPDYLEARSDRQRGEGIFRNTISVMRTLNDRGYGREGSGLVLNLVHNPAGAYLPGSQKSLEQEYRRRLDEEHGIVFNNLFCITNIPIGRYLEFLVKSGNYENYISELCGAYNPAALDSVMCRTTLSVGWNGTLYDCDFNQMLELPVNHGAPDSIFDFNLEELAGREIVIHNHCYGCVAGSGSSCQGSTVG